MFYDIRRLKGFSLAALAVVAGLGCYGLILQATLGRAGPSMLLRDQTFNVSLGLDRSFRRLLGIKRDFDSGTHPGPGERLGILFGSSTLVLGVDPSILEADIGGGYRWTNVHVATRANEVAVVSRMMYRDGLRPDVLALVANPGILAADGDREAERGWYDPAAFWRHLKGGKVELARTELVSLTMVPWHLIFPYRGQVFTLVDRQLFLAKLRMMESLGQGMEAFAAPEADPWRNDYPAEFIGAPASQEGNEKIRKFIGIKGWYEAENYRADGPNFAQLLAIFRSAHERGTKTFLVLVPESSGLRARLPESAADHLKRTLVDTLGDAAPVVLDYRDFAPDEDFFDVNHLNPKGREKLSHRLAEAMKPLLGVGVPKP